MKLETKILNTAIQKFYFFLHSFTFLAAIFTSCLFKIFDDLCLVGFFFFFFFNHSWHSCPLWYHSEVSLLCACISDTLHKFSFVNVTAFSLCVCQEVRFLLLEVESNHHLCRPVYPHRWKIVHVHSVKKRKTLID